MKKNTTMVHDALPLWRIPVRYHLSIIMLCLSAGEFADSRIRISRLSRFSLRTAEVDAVSDEILSRTASVSPESSAITKILNEKYKASISRFARLSSEKELLDVWSLHVLSGDCKAAYWALMSHAGATTRCRDRAHRQVYLCALHKGYCEQEGHRKGGNLQSVIQKFQEEKQQAEQIHQQRVCQYCRQIRQLKLQLQLSEYEVARLERHLRLLKYHKQADRG